MAKWLELEREPLFSQPDQMAFLEALRSRVCLSCRTPYVARPPRGLCPQCEHAGRRIFDRLTIIAGRRFGKSKIGSIAGVEESCFENSIGWACAPTIPKLHRYVIPAFQQLIPNEWVDDWNSEFKDLRLKNGALIHFQTLEDPDQGRGQGLDWLWIDEVCELTKAHWDVIRPSLAGNTTAFFTTSPRGYDWVYDELYKPAENGIPGYWATIARTIDSANPKISEEFLARERLQMSDSMYRQEYEADFVTFTGAVYGDLIFPQILRSREKIRELLPDYPIIEPWRSITIGIDTGADHPFGAVKLVATDKGLVAVAEYLEKDRSFFQHVTELKRLAGINPVRWAINKNERQAIIEFAQPQYGIICQKSENDQLAGIERVKTWLHNKQLWIVEDACPRLLKQLQALRWADARKDGQSRDKAIVYKKDDELPDCLRYALMSWPQLPEAPKETTVRDISRMPDSARWQIERMRRIEKPPDENPTMAESDFWL